MEWWRVCTHGAGWFARMGIVWTTNTMSTPITNYVEEKHDFDDGIEYGTPAPGVMLVFYENDKPHMVEFLCPCGCGKTCPTYLGQQSPRHWEYSPGPTLRPSMKYTSGCKAHFTITDGKVKMEADSGK